MKILTAMILSLLAFSAAAQGHLEITTTVQKEEEFVSDDGEAKKRLVTADIVVPGETVFYTITFRNISDESADNVVITNPIAENLVYVNGSGYGPGTEIEFSVDGGASFGKAKDLQVVENDVARPAEARDYTHVRWVVQGDLAAGEQGTARFAAVLE